MRADLLFFWPLVLLPYLIGVFEGLQSSTYLPRILTSFDRVAHFSRVCMRACTQIEIGLYCTVRRIQSIFRLLQI